MLLIRDELTFMQPVRCSGGMGDLSHSETRISRASRKSERLLQRVGRRRDLPGPNVVTLQLTVESSSADA